MLHYETPTLLRHGEVWIYHFPSRRQVTIRCRQDNVWVIHTRTLSGAGLIHNATTCSVTSGEMRTLQNYTASHMLISTPRPQKSFDLDTLIHILKTTFPQETMPHWHLIIAAVSCTFTILLVFYFSLRSKLQCSTSCCLRTNKSPEDATPQSSTHPVPVPEHPTTAAYSEQHCDSVTYARYAMPCKN